MEHNGYVDVPLRVRYADTDRMGIVYYGTYPIYLEVGRSEFMRTKGLPYRDLEEKGYSLVVTGIEIKYYNPALYDALLTVRTRVSDVQSRGGGFSYTVLRDGGNEADKDAALPRRSFKRCRFCVGFLSSGLPRWEMSFSRPLQYEQSRKHFPW
jgi:acyl-CoA thioester hydrolase